MALASGRPIPELVVEQGLLSLKQVADLLVPEALVSPRELLTFSEVAETVTETKDLTA
jgi:aspartate ammonia-lyase